MIYSYTEIISLERAKNYLRVDDDLDLDDVEIVSMINGAFKFIERYTNHIFKEQTFDLFGDFYSLKVYNYPITTFDPDDTARKIKQSYSLFTVPEDSLFLYTCGYDAVENVPDDFIQAALQMIKVWYYESEKQINEQMIPVSVKAVLDTYRRFI
jgi:hypothetical protein